MEKWLLFGVLTCLALLAGWLYIPRLLKLNSLEQRFVSCLMICIPFANGGYYTITAAIASVTCIFFLLKKGQVRIYGSVGFAAVFILWITAVICPLWAEDPAMAAIQSVKYWAVFLFAIVLMQFPAGQLSTVMSANIPCAVCMTAVSLILLCIPNFSQFICIRSSFAGLFEYANTYALFLLIAITLLLSREYFSRMDICALFILIFAITLTKSRTSWVLLAAVIIFTFLNDKQWKKTILVICIAILAVAAAGVISPILPQYYPEEGDVSQGGSSLLTRFLYWQDAISIIFHNPFGIGPLGYSTKRSAVQSGVYAVMYVHNELLQLLIDFGWIPALLLCTAAVKQLFQKSGNFCSKLLLAVILAHCMMDFDLQYLTIWMCVLPLLGLNRGKEYILPLRNFPVRVLACILSLAGIWLGISDYLYYTQQSDLCLRMMPAHTLALEQKLIQTQDAEEAEHLADRIVRINPNVSIAHSAKANAAFSRGDVLEMIEEKEYAINTNPYFLEEYMDYFEKLDYILQLYYQQGDISSAAFCLEKLQQIPVMLEDLKSRSSTLAWEIEHTPQVELPKAYLDRLEQWESLINQ